LKWITRTFLSFLILLLVAIFLLQTPFAKDLAKNSLIALAKEKGVELEVGQIDGVIPFEWRLKKVKCRYKGEEISANSLKFRLAILPLFHQELEVSYLKFQGGKFHNVPFTAVAKGKYDLSGNNNIKISNFLIEGENLFVRLEGKLNPDFSIKQGNLAFYLPDLSLFNQKISQGSAMGLGKITKESAKLECFIENLEIDQLPVAYSTLNLEATKQEQIWDGMLHLSSGHPDLPLTGQCHFSWGKELMIDQILVNSSELNLAGDLALKENYLEGRLIAKCQDLSIFQPLIPKTYIKGRLESQVRFTKKNVRCQLDLKNFAFAEVSGESLTIKSTIDHAMKGMLEIRGNSINHEKAKLAQIHFHSTIDPEHSPFEFAIKGSYGDPLQLKGSGSLERQLNGLLCKIDSIEGLALRRTILLKSPFSIDWTTQHFKLSNLSMDIGHGHLLSQIHLDKNSTEIKMNAHELPLEFIPIFYKHFSLAGSTSFDIDLVAKDNGIQGICHVALERAHFLSEGQKDPYTTKGSLQIHLNGNTAQVHADLKAKDKQFINLIGNFPIRLQHFPFKISLDSDQSFSSTLTAEGKLEDLFNFINIGQHRLEGWVSTQLHG